MPLTSSPLGFLEVADIENGRGRFSESSAFTRVVFPLPDGADTTMNLPSFNYNTFRSCSLIFSNSSFIWITTFCKPAWLALEPIVLISLPIS